MISSPHNRDGEYRFEFAGVVAKQITAVPQAHRPAMMAIIDRIAADPYSAGHVAVPPKEPVGRRVYRKFLLAGYRFPRLIIVFRVSVDQTTILVDQIRYFESAPEELTDE